MVFCRCMHAYCDRETMYYCFATLLILSVLGCLNVLVEGRLAMFSTNMTTIYPTTKSNISNNPNITFSTSASANITTKNIADNDSANGGSINNGNGTTDSTTTSNHPSNTTIDSNVTLCRCSPGSECWPSAESWGELNRSIGGLLVKPSPPASPCYQGPNQNATACQIVATNWMNPFWRADQVGAMQYSNNEAHGNQSCSLLSSPYFSSNSRPSFSSLAASSSSPPPTPSSLKCHQGSVPSFAITVLDPSHVQTAVRFAAQNNIRLSVKSTGHDFLGRSTAPGSLNLWMHRMKNITFHESFIPDGCDASTAFSAVTAESGTQWGELYAAADAANVVVVGAMSASVSTGGGFLQGGGHSPLSPFLGLAADNVLEMKVVTADGRLQTANACQNQDLFWALRGGGGGTFGVVVSCTHMTYPALINVVNVYFTATSSNATIFEELLTRFVSLQSSLSEDNYWAGYSYITSIPTLSLTLNYLAPNCKLSIAEASFESLINFTREHSEEITVDVIMRNFSSFLSWHSNVLCTENPGICSDPSGSNTRLASRLLPQNLLQEQPAQVAQVFMEILANGVGQIAGHLVGGQRVSSGLISWGERNASNSVNPAWRQAVWHVVLADSWGEQESPAVRLEKLTQLNGLLRELSPGSGCYLNEADVNEPNWQEAFFGEHYSSLHSVKASVDPEGLFTCTNCVGSEDWTIDNELLCRQPRPSPSSTL